MDPVAGTGGERFDQERPESLWEGRRATSRLHVRDPETLSPAAARYSRLPAGHPQGYQDSFNAFVADVYAAVQGQEPDGLPTFRDGLRAALLTDAVVRSAAQQTWVDVPQTDNLIGSLKSSSAAERQKQ